MDDTLSPGVKKIHPTCPLSEFVRQTMTAYFGQLDCDDIEGLHAIIIGAVEKPLLEATLEYSGHNQSKAAKALGLSRSTLRKKIDHYGLT